MCGSSPEPDAVAASAATTSMRPAANSDSIVALTRSTSFFEVGPRFDPMEFAAL